MQGTSPVVASGGHSSSRCGGLSLSRPLLLRSTGSRRAGSVVVAHGLSRSAACGIFPDQGSNPCPLHWQADSQPLRHQGSPGLLLLESFFVIYIYIFFIKKMRYDPHIINSPFKSVQCSSVLLYSQSCATIITIKFQNILITPKRNPIPTSSHSLFLLPVPGKH